MLTGDYLYLRREGFQVNFSFSLDNAQIIFNENTLLMLSQEEKLGKVNYNTNTRLEAGKGGRKGFQKNKHAQISQECRTLPH